MYLVEIPVAESDLPGRMMAMRAWLDHQRFEPDTFRYTPSAWKDGVFRVEFKFEREAAAFAEALGSRVVSGSNADVEPA